MMQAEYQLDFPAVAVNEGHELNLLVKVVGGVSQQKKQRVPLNLSVVLDRSGSMAGDKLTYVQKAAEFLVQHLTAQDYFSLVSYNHAVSVEVNAQLVGRKDRILHAIAKLNAGGTTNLSGGWLQGCQLVAENLNPQQVNRVLLLTDGLANQGVTDTARLKEMARHKREDKITTTTMGVGMDFDEDLLTQMAAEGGGAFYFIDNPDRTPHIFAEELRDLLAVVSQNLVISFKPSRDVASTITQLNTYATEERDGVSAFRLGDVYSEQEKSLLLRIAMPPVKETGQVQLGTIKIEYDEIAASSTVHRSVEYVVNIAIVSSDAAKQQEQNPEVLRGALMLDAARAREEAIKYADQREFDAAQQVLTNAADAIHESKLDDKELLQEHDMLREEAIDMSLGAERYDSYARKSSTSKVFHSTQRVRRDETVLVHGRLKASRPAIERHGQTPRMMKWKREQLELTMDELQIGRTTENDIVIPEAEVSDRHCRIFRRGQDYVLEDLSSTNGTFANGGKIDKVFRLSVGDVMTVGSWLFMFER
jgi:Ca-activated chloride channel homolog